MPKKTKLIDRQPTRLKCTKKNWCMAMQRALVDEQNARKKGLSVVELTNFETFKKRVIGICYKTKASARGVMLNVCPRCAEPILWDKEEESAVEAT